MLRAVHNAERHVRPYTTLNDAYRAIGNGVGLNPRRRALHVPAEREQCTVPKASEFRGHMK